MNRGRRCHCLIDGDASILGQAKMTLALRKRSRSENFNFFYVLYVLLYDKKG